MAEANHNNPRQSNVPHSIREVQQSFAESLGYYEEVIWDLLSDGQADILQKKIEFIIPDPPAVPENQTGDERVAAEKKVRKQCSENVKIRDTIFKSVWKQRKYTNGQSLTSIIYVMVATDERDYTAAPDSTKWSCHPVFRTRRCISDSNSSSDLCMIFVDELGRVYQNWRAYIKTNKLPAGIMVAPRRGIYNLVNGQVQLEKWLTPAASTKRRVLGVMDTTAVIGGFASAFVPIAALFALPIAAPVMTMAGAVGLGCAGYATFRSGSQLVDRRKHEQSINLSNRTARNKWLGVVAFTVALGASGAKRAMTSDTNAGREVGAASQLTVNAMNITSIMVSGTGLADSIIDLYLKYQDGDDISKMDALQLSASLVLFTHSVYNFKLASTIISETRDNKLGAYRKTLNNEQQGKFDKMLEETMRKSGATRGKVDIIRYVNEMPSREQFNDLYKTIRQLNERSDGQPAQLQPPNSKTPDQRYGSNSIYTDGVNVLRLSCLLINGRLMSLSEYGSIFEDINVEWFKNVLLPLADNLPAKVMKFILDMTKDFMDSLRQELRQLLKFNLTSESVLYKIGTHILDNYAGMNVKKLSEHYSEIFDDVKEYFMSLNPNGFQESLTKCNVCCGFYQICNL